MTGTKSRARRLARHWIGRHVRRRTTGLCGHVEAVSEHAWDWVDFRRCDNGTISSDRLRNLEDLGPQGPGGCPCADHEE